MQDGELLNFCEIWWHLKCTRVTAKLYDALIVCKSSGVKWFCKSCTITNKLFLRKCKEAEGERLLLRTQTEELRGNTDKLQTTVEKLKEKINSLEADAPGKLAENPTTTSSPTGSFAPLFKNSSNTFVNIDTLRNTLKKEEADISARQKNIVIKGLPKPDKDDDQTAVRELLATLDVDLSEVKLSQRWV